MEGGENYSRDDRDGYWLGFLTGVGIGLGLGLFTFTLIVNTQ